MPILIKSHYDQTGLAVISLCISLIQEQVGRSAAIALGIKGEVIEMDEVEIVGRIPNFLESDQTGQEEDVAERVTVPVATGVVEPTIPGEAKVDDDEENEDEVNGLFKVHQIPDSVQVVIDNMESADKSKLRREIGIKSPKNNSSAKKLLQ